MEPQLPAGAGEPHARSGGFSVQAQDLVNAAKEWDELSGDMVDARMKCETGWGLPGIFGFADTLYRSAGCTRRSTARPASPPGTAT